MVLLQAKELSKIYGTGGEDVVALAPTSLEVHEGEFVAITGPSGSGKSTLLGLLAGLEQPTAGEVWLNGQRLSDLPDAQIARFRRRHVGFVFQTFNLVPVLSLAENVALPFALDGTPAREWHARVDAALEAVGLSHRRDHLPESVSVGERQRTALARALATTPKILFADEPTGSLDSQRGEKVLSLLRKANQDTGLTVLMVTHDLGLAAMAGRTLRMKDGRLE